MERLLNQIILKNDFQISKELHFLEFHRSNNKNVNFPQISSPYLYLILEGAIQLPTLEKYKQGNILFQKLQRLIQPKLFKNHFALYL